MLVSVFKIFSETTGPTEAKFHVEPQWDRGGKFIQRIPVICCSSFEYSQPLGAEAFRGAFTAIVAPQCRAFSRALEIEKLKAPLFGGPEGAGDTNDWCIILKAAPVKQHIFSPKTAHIFSYFCKIYSEKINKDELGHIEKVHFLFEMCML